MAESKLETRRFEVRKGSVSLEARLKPSTPKASKEVPKPKERKRIARRESTSFSPEEVEKVKSIRSLDAIEKPSLEQKVAVIASVANAFGFGPEETAVILRQLNRESWNSSRRMQYDPKVVAGGDNTGITQIRPGTAREAAQRLGISDLRFLSQQRGVIDTNRLDKKGNAVTHAARDVLVIRYLQSRWATNIVLGISYLAFLRKRAEALYPSFSSIQPPKERMRYVLAAYNCGETKAFRIMTQRQAAGGISWSNVAPFLPGITREYVRIAMEDNPTKRKGSISRKIAA